MQKLLSWEKKPSYLSTLPWLPGFLNYVVALSTPLDIFNLKLESLYER